MDTRADVHPSHPTFPFPGKLPACPDACIATTGAERPRLGTATRQNLFLEILEQVRLRYGFIVVGYVVMPEHIHLLISEPNRGTPSTVRLRS